MRATLIVLGFATFLVAYGYALTVLVPRKWYSYLNIFVALGGLAYGKLVGGLSWSELGLGWSSLPKGIFVGLCLGVPLVLAIYEVSRHPKFMPHFLEAARVSKQKTPILHDLSFRLPFGTSLSEEILFRGVLLGMLLSHYSVILSTLIASFAFGLWHIAPTLANLAENKVAREVLGSQKYKNASSVIANIFTTMLGGIGFSILRLYTGSLFTPWLIHSLLNGAALLSGHIHAKNEDKRR